MRDSGAGLAFNSFPRADCLLKTRRETRTVRFIGVCRCVDIRQIDSARSNVTLRRVALSALLTNYQSSIPSDPS
jgi:hypothetical protein